MISLVLTLALTAAPVWTPGSEVRIEASEYVASSTNTVARELEARHMTADLLVDLAVAEHERDTAQATAAWIAVIGLVAAIAAVAGWAR